MNINSHYDVIIAGGGPVGLFLAHELGIAGISVLVLERDATPSPWKAKPLGMRGLTIPSTEAFYRRGMLNEVFDPSEGSDKPFVNVRFQFAGHFAGIMLDGARVDSSKFKHSLPGPSFTGGRTYIDQIEALLGGRAEKLGVKILRGMNVSHFEQSDEGVIVQAGDQTFSAKYLVGCDGGQSKVRKIGAFEFVGTEPILTGYTISCELDDPKKLKIGFNPTSTGLYVTTGPEQVAFFDFDGGTFDRSRPLTLEHLQTVLRRVSGTNVAIKKVYLASTFTDRTKQATTYNKGRVFLAGDSAHIHSPLGGQGLNTGLADAVNLGWKLAAVIKGQSANSLLDTYTLERHPAGAWALEWTRAQVAILKPDSNGQALMKIVRDLCDTVEGTTYFVEKFRGLAQRYDLGNSHPLVGRSAPDFEFSDGTRLGAKLESARGLLLDFTGFPELRKFASESVDYLNLKANEQLGLTALLIRPDGIVAWASDQAPELQTLKLALW